MPSTTSALPAEPAPGATAPAAAAAPATYPAACPVCDGGPLAPAFEVAGWPLLDCPACGHRTTVRPAPGHVERVYGDDYFTAGGAGYPDYLAEADLLVARGRRYGELAARRLGRRGRVLDAGAAAGFTLQGFAAAGWEGVGVEPNERMAAHGRGLGLDVRTGTLEEFAASEPPGTGPFDLVCLLQVIAHLVEPRRALERACRLLAPGGAVLVETWDRRSLTARLFGRRWHEYSPPSVLHWFSAESLGRLAAALDLVPVAAGRPRRRIAWRHSRSLLAEKLGPGPAGRAFARLARPVPDGWAIPYPLDDLRWWLFRRRPGR